jgi:hypothetical protein
MTTYAVSSGESSSGITLDNDEIEYLSSGGTAGESPSQFQHTGAPAKSIVPHPADWPLFELARLPHRAACLVELGSALSWFAGTIRSLRPCACGRLTTAEPVIAKSRRVPGIVWTETA